MIKHVYELCTSTTHTGRFCVFSIDTQSADTSLARFRGLVFTAALYDSDINKCAVMRISPHAIIDKKVGTQARYLGNGQYLITDWIAPDTPVELLFVSPIQSQLVP